MLQIYSTIGLITVP